MKKYSLDEIRQAICINALFAADYVGIKCAVVLEVNEKACALSTNTGSIRQDIAMLEMVLASHKKRLAEEGDGEPTPSTHRSVQ